MQKKTAFAALLLSLGLLLNGSDVFSQTSSSTGQFIYLESTSLTTEKYSQLFERLKTDSNIQIVEACVPAHVFSVKIKNAATPQTAFESFQNQCGDILKDIKLLNAYNDELFMQRCSNARYGRN